MATDIALAERMLASQSAVPRRGTGATFSHSHSDQAIQPYLCDTTAVEASTRRAGASNDSSPSSPFPSGTKVKSDSLGSAAVYRRREMDRKIAIVPIKVDTPGAAMGDETALSVPNATQPTLPSPLAGRRESVVGAQLAASGPALVPPPDTNLFSLYDVPSPLTPSSPSSAASLSPTTPKFTHSPSSAGQEKPRIPRSLAHSRTPSRDVGIVGTRTRLERPQNLATVQDTRSDYQPPIFQTPSSRSSSLDISTPVDSNSREPNPLVQVAFPGEAHVRPTAMSASVEPIPSAPHVMNGHAIHTQPLSDHSLNTSLPRPKLVDTPEQGQALPAAASSVSSAPSSYLHYQPGVHSRAGPLPPPPRAMFDIDFNAPPPPRPPRLRSPSPLTSQKALGGGAPTSVTVRLASKPSTVSIHQIQISATPPLSTQSSSEDSDYPESETGPTKPVHHSREGAFPPSSILATPAERLDSLPDQSVRLVPEVPSKDQLPEPPTDVLDSPPAITVQPANGGPSPSTAHPPELRRESSWISNSNDSSHVSSEGSRRAFEDARIQELNDSYSSMREFSAEDSPSEPKRKGGILTNLKRYSSLPRTPSIMSQRMSVFTRSPPPRSPPKPRIRARSPDAMRFKEILKKKSVMERANAYANKINELSMYDCGLSDWVTSMKEKGSSKTRLVSVSPSQNPDSDLDPRPRHSRASISSECTFPLRGDAYIATDLSLRDSDTVPSPNAPPPALPYPALAGVSTVNSRHSTTTGAQLSHAPSLSMGSKVAGSFFSSIGRNVSTRKDVGRPALPARTKKPSLTAAPNPRPVQINTAPSVPGGPRALPGRVQRSQTLMLSSPGTSGNAPTSLPMRRRSNTLKRPSFFGRVPGASPELDGQTSTEFTRQVDRLADLLPHANKDVLAGYLGRAGQDILAIGQYLEDEKNGTVRRH